MMSMNSLYRTKLPDILVASFSSYDIDCEYNRDLGKEKYLENKLIRPDIIIHKRNTNENLLAIEVKKADNAEIECDRIKLKKLTTDEKFKYAFGALVILGTKANVHQSPIFEIYEDGNLVSLS